MIGPNYDNGLRSRVPRRTNDPPHEIRSEKVVGHDETRNLWERYDFLPTEECTFNNCSGNYF